MCRRKGRVWDAVAFLRNGTWPRIVRAIGRASNASDAKEATAILAASLPRSYNTGKLWKHTQRTLRIYEIVRQLLGKGAQEKR